MLMVQKRQKADPTREKGEGCPGVGMGLGVGVSWHILEPLELGQVPLCKGGRSGKVRMQRAGRFCAWKTRESFHFYHRCRILSLC